MKNQHDLKQEKDHREDSESEMKKIPRADRDDLQF